MSYTNIKLNISNKQKNKIKNALSSGADNITIRLKYEDLTGNDIIALTKGQINKLSKAYELGKGSTITMSKAQIKYNMKIKGGFLPLLASLAAKAIPFLTSTVLPALGVGALSSLASTGMQKLAGDGLYLKRGGRVCEVETDGQRILLEPISGNEFAKLGNGLYLKRGGQLYSGKGLLLGENSPFKNIPILGMLL